jgi:hypothetical protein
VGYLPAVQMAGEGIPLKFNVNKLNQWLTDHQETWSARFDDRNISERSRRRTVLEMLLHTFSHIMIKELEFLCGYPAVSLQRLYV